MTLEDAQKLIGQKVFLTKNDLTIGGTLQFVGPNEHFPSWGIQATIDRMPVTNIDLNKLKVQPKVITNKD